MKTGLGLALKFSVEVYLNVCVRVFVLTCLLKKSVNVAEPRRKSALSLQPNILRAPFLHTVCTCILAQAAPMGVGCWTYYVAFAKDCKGDGRCSSDCIYT